MAHLSRLIAIAIMTFAAAQQAAAVDCPVDPTTGEVIAGWSTARSPTGTYATTHEGIGVSVCGQTTNYAITIPGHAPFATFGEAMAYVDTYQGTGSSNINEVCATLSGANYLIRVVYWNSPHTVTHAGRVTVASTATPCTPPLGDDADCGGTDIGVGQARHEGDSSRDMWGHVTVVAPTWGEAVGEIPDCVPIGGSDTSCTVTGIYKTGPGLNKNGAGSYEWVASIRYGGGACTPGEGAETPVPEDNTQGENCETSDAGVEYCHENKNEGTEADDTTGCGWYEDELVCTDQAEDDECWVGASGARYCGQDAPMPPVPDSGTPGEPAEPDDTIRDPDTDDEFDRYTPEQSDGSSRPVGDSGANPNRPGSTNPSTPTQPVAEQGDGGGDGEGEGDGGEASGGESCVAAPTCDGDAIACAILAQEWRTRCPGELTGDELGDLEGGFSEGELDGTGHGEDGDGEGEGEIAGEGSGSLGSMSCPSEIHISVMGQSIDLDVWGPICDYAALFAPFVLLMAHLFGVLILVKGI